MLKAANLGNSGMKHPRKEHRRRNEGEKHLGGTEGQRQAFREFCNVWTARVASFIEDKTHSWR
jgi:hypothetical protein